MSKILNKSTAQLVKKVLTSSDKAKDDDKFIQVAIWNKEIEKLGLNDTKAFLNAYYLGKVTDPNAVSRVRRKLQELYPELRGDKYEDRQEKYQEQAKETIKKIR